MEGDSNRKPNANDWRSMHEPDLRKRIIFAIVEKLKICFPKHSQNDINNTASKFEGKIYGMATDKSDYLRKISEKIMVFDKKFRSVQSGSLVNETNTPDTAQALNQGPSVHTTLPYMQTPTSQQQFHQYSNLNTPASSGFSTQVPITVSAAQNLNIQMGEGVHGRQQLLPQPQQQPQSYDDIFQRQKDAQQHAYMQQHAQQQYHQQSPLKPTVQHQLPHHTSLSTIQSFPQPSYLSSLTSSDQQNSQYLPRHQFPTQRVHSSHQQQMAVPSQAQTREELISQLMNGQDTFQNHLTSQQNNWEQQGPFTLPSTHQNNIASFQDNNLQNMHQQQRLYSQPDNASAFPSQQQQYMLQQYQPQQPQHRILQQYLDDTQRFQAAASQDSAGTTANANGEDWQEETYQKIKALKEKYLPLLSTLLQKLSEKLGEVDSLPQQKMQHEPIQKLKEGKLTLELIIMYLNVGRDSISESHRDKFSLYEEQVLRFTKNQHTVTRSPMQHQQSPSGHNQHSNTSPAQSSMFHQKQFHHLQMQHQLMQSQQQQQPQTNQQQPQIQNQSSPQLVDQLILPTTFHNTAGTSSQFLVSPFEKPTSVHSVTTTLPLDIIPQTDSYKLLSSLESEADSTASSGSKVHKIEPGCALLQEIKDINGSLVETVVNICNEEFYPSEVTSGTIVTCSYSPVALSDTLEAHYKSGHIIQPLRLLVPVNYPYSPILFLEKVPSDASLHKYGDLSARTRSRFSLSMKEFSEPMSLKDIAQVWDVCSRETMAEYCERHGGGTFSSNHGHWESVLGAS
ncbi:probable mediator of RNA polymerase II transcription subunit 15c isoform X2 [Raphanus sativus]|uniref:Probable mediator of RNA polymerase II transcription subunit 15c isoform X2 n=1 Tax=Raphanus sativus TaxID=3726 RepID=A0A9W3CNJ7_RAPSA|nr:probable mediator of RNA polymerase II transcription subunit 15c isoform X2 [Raphanus sativus]